MKKALCALLLVGLVTVGCSENDMDSPMDTYESEPITPETLLETPAVSAEEESEEITDLDESECDPNYSGCVPVASDVDCIGGSGNGPEYTGQVRVIGIDIYDLDRDGDGIACE